MKIKVKMLKKIKELLEKSEDEELLFDDRYSDIIKDKIKNKNKQFSSKNYSKKVFDENRIVIEKLKKFKNRSKKLNYFDELHITDKRIKELIEHKKSGGKVIGTFCNLVPEELIYAAGAVPVRLCSGCNHSISPAEEMFPRDSCSLIKSSFGFAVTDDHYMKLCDVIIMPATCDGKKKLGEILNDYKPVWMLDLPQNKEREISKKYWLSEIRILKKRIEKLTGNKINKSELKNAIELLHERYDVIRDFQEVRKSLSPVILGSDFFIVIQAAFFDDIKRWIENTRELIDDLNNNIENNLLVKDKNDLRLLLTGAPIILPNFKIPEMIEEFEAFIAIDETCAGSQFIYDPVVVEEWTLSEMLSAIAERYLMPSVCPCFIKSEDRIDKIMTLIEDFKVDAVIYHTLRLCLLFDVESMRVSSVLEENDIPFLHLNTDYSKEDLGQLRTRIEAFIEILHSKR